MPRTQVPKKWQTHPGNNRFYCKGRCMMAKDTGIFWFTCALVVGTSALFFAFDCVYLAEKVSPAVPVIGGLLVVFVLGTLFRTGCSDPGILPRASDDEAAFLEQQYEPERDENGQVRNQPRLQELTVAGQNVKVKYCYTCRMFRPPRASHCSVCNNCVDRFDHHCPWVGNCIGARNYRYFYQFILSLALLAAYIFAFAVTNLVLRSQKDTFVTAMKDSPASIVEMLVVFVSVWSILGLCGFHTYLVASELTTNEDIKGTWAKKRNQEMKNPYSKGNLMLNCCYVLCGPLPPSLLDLRSPAELNQPMNNTKTEYQVPSSSTP